MLDLCCCAQAFSSYGHQGLLSSCRVEATSCGAQVVGTQASVVAASRLSSVAHGLSCSTACGILPNQELNPGPLHWQADFLSTVPPGKC